MSRRYAETHNILCHACNGSGEGMTDGSRCQVCHGRGGPSEDTEDECADREAQREDYFDSLRKDDGFYQ